MRETAADGGDHDGRGTHGRSEPDRERYAEPRDPGDATGHTAVSGLDHAGDGTRGEPEGGRERGTQACDEVEGLADAMADRAASALDHASRGTRSAPECQSQPRAESCGQVGAMAAAEAGDLDHASVSARGGLEGKRWHCAEPYHQGGGTGDTDPHDRHRVAKGV